jgi:pantoate--beta-alanine ligase
MTRLVRTPEEITEYVDMLARHRASVGFVPTMGALHEGHLSLMRRSYRENDRTIVSIYVNPLQFGPEEDLERYPRDLESDLARCELERVDVVFAPGVAAMQPPGRSTVVHVAGVSHDYEGAYREGHFDGVATIVAQLLNLVRPQRAYFGRKDFQQSVVIRRMVHDLSMPVDVVVCPTVRDEDGLALSSRNAYLTRELREQALRLPRALFAAQASVAQGERDADRIRAAVRSALEPEGADVELQYADVVSPDTLVPVAEINGRAVLVAAYRVGTTRLLDNVVLEPPATPEESA